MEGLTAQPWEMAENATYAITLGGGNDDEDVAESASSDHVQVYLLCLPETHSLVAVKIIPAVRIIFVVDFGGIIVTKECKKLQ